MGHQKWFDVPYTPASYWDFPRTKAKANRQKSRHWFDGSVCEMGHVAPRYVSTGGCVLCVQLGRMTAPEKSVAVPVVVDEVMEKRQNRARREEAQAQFSNRYEPVRPCQRCGGRDRYTSNNWCVACTKALVAANLARKQGAA